MLLKDKSNETIASNTAIGERDDRHGKPFSVRHSEVLHSDDWGSGHEDLARLCWCSACTSWGAAVAVRWRAPGSECELAFDSEGEQDVGALRLTAEQRIGPRGPCAQWVVSGLRLCWAHGRCGHHLGPGGGAVAEPRVGRLKTRAVRPWRAGA